jgi:hypothetical protein
MVVSLGLNAAQPQSAVPRNDPAKSQPAPSSQDSGAKSPSDAARPQAPAEGAQPEGTRPDGARPDGQRPEGSRGDGPRRGMPPLSEEMFEQVIAVGKDVSPEFGEQLEKLRNLSPEEKSQAMRQNARRLVTLAVLKRRNQELYDTRVKELRVQLELHALGEKYMAAETAKDASAMATLTTEIQKKVKLQVNLDLKARAQELKAMDKQLEDLKTELEQEIKETAERIAQRVEAVKKGEPIKGRGFSGDGDGRSREDRPKGEAPHDGAKPKGG